ncbi:MAG TPA: patatin-like phospholipase family protein [Nocardioidaceae bacterium]|nr:patatin-like phospholipase family protein [Nocardioidaceae bacterium]
MSDTLHPPAERQLASEPVRRLGDRDEEPETGTALCLSGGGYRAMVFHVGVLWRLNEAGLLPGLGRVSSVSGGSITAGVLAKNWSELQFRGDVAQRFTEAVAEPVRVMARKGVDVSSVLRGAGLPWVSIADRVEKAYDDTLFHGATLQDLPDEPRFVFNSTNLESGVLMRFSKPYLADYRVGRVLEPSLPLALAVTASSAFPPFLSPCKLDLSRAHWVSDEGNDLAGRKGFRDVLSLCDGGVYDNLGIETSWKRYRTVLVSDAGGHMGADPSVPGDWARGLLRVLSVIDNQVRALRKQQVVGSFRSGDRGGMYVGIRSDLAGYPVRDPLPAEPQVTRGLAAMATRLDAMPDDVQEKLVNWGYVICDAGLRSYVDQNAERGALPYPDNPLDGV